MSKRRKSIFQLDNPLSQVESSTKRGVLIVILFALAFLSLLSIFDLAGGFGRCMYHLLKLIFGWGFWIFPLILLMVGYLYLNTTRYSFSNVNWVGMFLLIIGYSGFFHLTQDPDSLKETLNAGIGGGYIGFVISYPLFKIMGRWAAMVVAVAFFVIGILLMFNTSLENILAKASLKGVWDNLFFWRMKLREDDREDEQLKEEDEIDFKEKELADDETELISADIEQEPVGDEADQLSSQPQKKRYPKIDIPLELLSNQAGKPTAGDIKFYQERIGNTLAHFGIGVEMGEVSVGPTVTQYTFRPAEGVKLSRIIGLSNDLALALAAHPIRIEAPIPGKSLVGVEVPNKKIAIVPLRHVLESREFKNRKTNLSICMGQDVAGQPWIVDLERLPHLLVAGATNSGKTVCLNSIIISLLYQNQPDELKFILVDPKRVEMPGYNGIPHLLAPVITDIKKTINALKWTISEMERRFQVLSNAGKRNIQSYNITHPREKLPYLIFVIDELADLMSIASAEVEAAVIRLAQMSRAVGIHLILATQRPSVDIITGLIKANIPGRIAFSVASLTDSRTILDVSGAEKLLGRGDMLFSSAELSKPKRLQGAFCTDEDIEQVVAYLKQQAAPDYEEGVTEKIKVNSFSGMAGLDQYSEEDGDEFLDEARELVIKAGKASASYLQRRLRIGYARAARLLDLLEEEGTIGQAEGSKPREILITDSRELDNDEIVEEMGSEEETEESEIDEDKD